MAVNLLALTNSLRVGTVTATIFVLLCQSSKIMDAAPAPNLPLSTSFLLSGAMRDRNLAKRSTLSADDHVNNNNKASTTLSLDADSGDKLAAVSYVPGTRKSSEDLRRSLCTKVDEQIQELLMKYAEFTFKNCIQKQSVRLPAAWIAPVSREDLCRKAEQEVQDVVAQHVEFLQTYCTDVSITLNQEAFLK